VAKPSPETRVRDFYGFPFPDDFFRFREFLSALPRGILGRVCDMHPAFPFAIAAGRSARHHPEHPHWEDHYYRDLPEFVTLFTGTMDGLHWGYVFDAPGELPPGVAHYYHSDTFEHTPDGASIFEAVRLRVEEVERDFLEMIEADPDGTAHERRTLRQVAKIRERLSKYWGADRKETGEEYLDEHDWGDDGRACVAETWDDLGIVVPEGKYRKLKPDPFDRSAGGEVKPKRRQIKQLAAEAMQLLEKGYPGAALKLGRDLWVWASDFPEAYSLLDAAYTALGRETLRPRMAEAQAFRAHCDGPRRTRRG